MLDARPQPRERFSAYRSKHTSVTSLELPTSNKSGVTGTSSPDDDAAERNSDDERCSNKSTELAFSGEPTSIYRQLLSPTNSPKQVGAGAFGTVYKCTVPGSGEVVAVKKVFQDPQFQNRELDTLLLLSSIRNHDNAIELKDHYREEIQHETWLFLVMDYMPYTIFID